MRHNKMHEDKEDKMGKCKYEKMSKNDEMMEKTHGYKKGGKVCRGGKRG